MSSRTDTPPQGRPQPLWTSQVAYPLGSGRHPGAVLPAERKTKLDLYNARVLLHDVSLASLTKGFKIQNAIHMMRERLVVSRPVEEDRGMSKF